jgi:hypothetical protein
MKNDESKSPWFLSLVIQKSENKDQKQGDIYRILTHQQ